MKPITALRDTNKLFIAIFTLRESHYASKSIVNRRIFFSIEYRIQLVKGISFQPSFWNFIIKPTKFIFFIALYWNKILINIAFQIPINT